MRIVSATPCHCRSCTDLAVKTHKLAQRRAGTSHSQDIIRRRSVLLLRPLGHQIRLSVLLPATFTRQDIP